MINCQFESGNKASLRHVVVDCIIVKDNQILLVKRVGKLLEGGKWALVGGFVESDETLEECLVREIKEEAGYTVKDIKLFRIIDNPDRRNEDRQNISFVYLAWADKKIGEGDWETEGQKWFKLDNLPPKEDIAFDHFDNIELYKQHLKNPFLLPVIK
ncbi:NUDIX hydrolase [Candidatus Gottesmanbacteria bacterium]|nr:NUDIX hydrolase [Candidatus Gottesmanbacteria bacterium]